MTLGILYERRAPMAGVVPNARALHFNDICAEIGKVLCAPWAGKNTAEV
jgi:hypothetical protein